MGIKHQRVESAELDPDYMSDSVRAVALGIQSEQGTAFWLVALDPANVMFGQRWRLPEGG